jgi:hypothetical protein
LGDAVLLAAIGLLKAALDSDDSLWARHLELEVGVVRADHELGEARSTKQGMVDTEEVNDLKGEWLLLEVVWLAKGDDEPDAPKGYGLPQHDPIEWYLAGEQVAPRNAHLVKGVGVEYVEAVAPVH